jgi:anti-sigma regulatory factor (Ser/Thr protein kinase)
MKLNVARKIKHYKLAKTKAYYSIFEAISNSIDSYLSLKKPIEIWVEFYRDNTGLDLGNEAKNYQQIRIIDQGIGFNKDNYDSFNTSDSDYKEIYGGKGLGRFSWLKVFEEVKVESVYQEGGKYYLRKFDFKRTEEGIANSQTRETSKDETGTTISLINQKKGWEIPRKISTFCEKLIEGFLPLFVNNANLQITLTDKDVNESINVQQYFKENYRGEIGSTAFEIKGKPFSLSVHKSIIGNANQFILFAHNRATKIIDLSRHIIDLNAKLEENSEEFHIMAFLTGQYLDGIVSPERDDFDFDNDEADITMDELTGKSFSEIKTLIQNILANIHRDKEFKIKQFIANEAPEYRYILQKRPEIIDAIRPTASKADIETHLHSAEMQYKEETRLEVAKILQKEDIDNDEIERVYLEVSETAKADLAKYIISRNRVMELLDKKISLNDDKKYNKEDELHKLFYQMKVTSDSVPYECNNLWLIDERLNFHDYLASDLPLDGDKGDRPDIIVYNVPHYFNNVDTPNNSFSIIEFKRPMRDDYSDNDNPIEQIVKYIDEIRAGKAKKQNGQIITVTPTTPCFAYAVCTLTPNIRRICERRDFNKSYDNLGYFFYIKNFNTYFEVLSYEKIVKDAKIRNRIFMKKLELK